MERPHLRRSEESSEPDEPHDEENERRLAEHFRQMYEALEQGWAREEAARNGRLFEQVSYYNLTWLEIWDLVKDAIPHINFDTHAYYGGQFRERLRYFDTQMIMLEVGRGGSATRAITGCWREEDQAQLQRFRALIDSVLKPYEFEP